MLAPIEWHRKMAEFKAVIDERARLEKAVIEACKAERAAETHREGDTGIDRLIATARARRLAVSALIAFESEHES